MSAAADPGSITRVAGIEVGHFTDTRRPTGCSVVLAHDGAVAGVDVRGAAPGTRETDLLHPCNLVDKVHAIVLSGGSAWGWTLPPARCAGWRSAAWAWTLAWAACPWCHPPCCLT